MIKNLKKHFFALCIALFGLCALFCFAMPVPNAYAESNIATTYYRDQLSEMALNFYSALESMSQNQFKKGDLAGGGYDLVSHSIVNQTDLARYASGSRELTLAFGAARDAFASDYPEIFFVDYSNLSLRITQNGSNYSAILGAGRTDSYLNGFNNSNEVESAISALDAEVSRIATNANTQNSIYEKIIFVHDYLTSTVEYKLECDATADAVPFVHSAYGALVKKQAVCEGYAKAFKLIMDELNIPCIVVNGLYSASSSQREAHMWNYVKIDNEYYAVDVTMDDPLTLDGGLNVPTHEYLLKTSSYMEKTHLPDGILSGANFEFKYPALANSTANFYDGNLKVGIDYSVETNNQGDTVTFQNVNFSYLNLSYREVQNLGYEILISTWNDGQDRYWATLDFILINNQVAFTENDNLWTLINSVNMEIAVIKNNSEYFSNYSLKPGYEKYILEQSGIIVSPKLDRYPHITSATPIEYRTLEVGKIYDVKITFNEELIPTTNGNLSTNQSQIGVMVEGDENHLTAKNNCKLTDFVWDKNTISFKFAPSQMYGDDLCGYTFTITGLVGKDSLNKPATLYYYAVNKAVFDCPTSDGINYRVYAKPVLLENDDLSTAGWQYADGTTVQEDISYRMALIASKPSAEENEKYSEALESYNPLAMSTYNIDLTLCQKQIASLPEGQRIKVMLAFPDGYGPEDEGVTFKAFHFKKDGTAEEIDCVVNKFGLVLYCNSFSPFAVIATAKTNEPVVKKIYVQTNKGGYIQNNSYGLLQEGIDEYCFIRTNDGFVIESITLNGKPVTDNFDPSANTIYTMIALNYETLNENNVLEIKYVDYDVKQLGQVVVPTLNKNFTVKITGDGNVKLNSSVTLTANTDALGSLSYTWYKGDTIILGEYGETLTLTNVTKEDLGEYKVKVTANVGQDSASATSKTFALSESNSNFIYLIIAFSIILIGVLLIARKKLLKK